MSKHPGRAASYAFLIALAFIFGVGLAGSLEWNDQAQAVSASAPRGVVGPETSSTPPITVDTKRSAGLSDAFVGISEAVTPAVVRIQTERMPSGSQAGVLPRGLRGLFGGPEDAESPAEVPPEIAGGSGFLVSDDGYILTNNHVVEGFDHITVSLLDRRAFEARVVGRDPTTDVAVIKIDAKGLPYVRLGNSDEARVGEWVLAIGNPGFEDPGASTLDFTVTTGIISAKGRPLQIINSELQAEQSPVASYAIEDFIQTDAVINPGNSGGPLVNLRGEVIGINTAIASGTGFYQGYGFAIPSNLAQRVMNDLVAEGHVRRALLGISISDVSPEDAEVYRLPRISGVRVDDFSEDAPARRAGVQRHDVIVSVDGQPVERVGQLQRLVAQHRPGENVRIGVIRYGEPHEFEIRLTEAPLEEAEAPRRAARRNGGPVGLGMTIEELTPTLARRADLTETGGAIISRVAPFSPASRKGVTQWDRIVELNGTSVGSARQAEAALRQLHSGQIASLVLRGRDDQLRIANIRVP